MKLAFVLPKYGVSIHDPCCYPLGFMYVATWARQHGHDIKVFNFNLWDDIDLEKELKPFDAVCMTGATDFYNSMSSVKRLGKPMIIGGSMATHNMELAKTITQNVHIGEIETCSIDDIGEPAYDLFEIEEYHKRHSFRYMGVLTSRGCPFRCTFCAHVCSYRVRNLADVEKEIKRYKEIYGITSVVFNDNTLNVSRKRFLDICQMMKPLELKWSAAIRADKFDAEMAEAFIGSGGEYFVIGIESFRQDRLNRMNKRLKVDHIYRTLDTCHVYNIKYHGNIILGIDDETVEDITSEVEQIPFQYNVFPVLAHKMDGTRVSTNLSPGERSVLNGIFTDYAVRKGMSVYPLS